MVGCGLGEDIDGLMVLDPDEAVQHLAVDGGRRLKAEAAHCGDR